ncbi:hypothetical protein DPMN_163836 [Dreissena polymorpha]|uniref:Uncharacterized protein n=1 Tax=Dreissena polymorpha TaxID=45954 RepID=A0A9D4EUQ2_DREPO|nr:hypothetical protein DPMN_163836 [Dreissena polymorpha]
MIKIKQEGHGGSGRSPENTNILTKFHEHWTKNVTSRENCPAPGSHVFQQTRTIFKLIQDIVRKNVLTKFHEDWTINVTSRVLTRFYYTLQPYKVNCRAPWRQYIIGTHTKHVTSRVLTRKLPRPLAAMFFNQPEPFFELVQDIIITNVLTKFHKDWRINVTSRVLTRFYYSHIKKLPRPLFHADWTKNVTSRPFFQPTGTIFELVKDTIEIHVLTKFHEDWTINVNVDDARRTTHNARRTKGDHNSSL